MGLFGFVKDIGRNLFNKDEEAAKEIKGHIEANNPGVKDLEVKYDNGIVSLCGECDSVDAYDKTVLMAGNVKGVADVYAAGLKVRKSAQPAGGVPVATAAAQGAAPAGEQVEYAAKVEYYVIKKGDTLSKIAKHYYGKANAYPRIFEANREVIQDADLIFPGQKIRIPMD